MTSYSWELRLSDRQGGKSGPNGTGGKGNAELRYKTTITLPAILTDTVRDYTMLIKAGTYGNFPGAGPEDGIGKMATISLNKGTFTKNVQYSISTTNNSKIDTIFGLLPGTYNLTLDEPPTSIGSKGVFFTNTDDPAIKREGIFETSVLINITANLKPKAKPVVQKTIPAWTYAAGGLLLLILIVVFALKKRLEH